jgi:hypothetical protein
MGHTYNNQRGSDGGDLELKHVCVSITRKKKDGAYVAKQQHTNDKWEISSYYSLRTPGS